MQLRRMIARSTFMGAVLSSLVLHAETTKTIETQIKQILSPRSVGEDYLLLAKQDGRVYHVSPQNPGLVESLSLAVKTRGFVNLDVTLDKGEVLSFENSSKLVPPILPFTRGAFKFDNSGYTPTNVPSAQALFDELPEGSDATECFQRAHYWTYKLWKHHGIKSMKVFLFFTEKYIREYGYEWWFHVAPYVVQNGEPTVIDITFSEGPQDLNTWKNDYIYSGAACPTVNRYSDYENHQESRDCYFMRVPMYYYQPLDMETFEHDGQAKVDWVDWEVDAAKFAF